MFYISLHVKPETTEDSNGENKVICLYEDDLEIVQREKGSKYVLQREHPAQPGTSSASLCSAPSPKGKAFYSAFSAPGAGQQPCSF